MAEYSQEEQLNELSRIFRGQVVPEKTGGQVDPEAIHAQVIEIAKTVFLLNPGAVFYLAALVRNSLLISTRQEIAIVEDMLAAIDDLREGTKQNAGLIGQVGPVELSNAETALLALEFAASVRDRPELTRFQRIMDRFTGLFQANVIGPDGTFILPRGEAREVLRTNMLNLTTVHANTLALVTNLLSLIDEYNDLDIPSQVSQTALINIRTSLVGLRSSIVDSEAEDLITNSRLIVLRSLASKVAVALLDQFNTINLAAPILTSDNEGLARDPNALAGPYLARSTGEGTPAAIITSPGPWRLADLSTGTLSIKVDNGAEQSFDLSVIQGPGLHGTISAPFADSQLYPVWPGPPNNIAPYLGGADDPPPPPREDFEDKPNLHITLDKTEYEFQGLEFGYVNTVNVFFGAVGDDNDPPAPDNNPPPPFLPDSAYTGGVLPFLAGGDNPRLYPDIGLGSVSHLANNSGTVGELISDYYNTVRMEPAVKLGFKHLGCPVFFALGEVQGSVPYAQTGAGFGGWNCDGQDTLEDAGEFNNIEDRRWDYILRPRTVWELTHLGDIDITHVGANTYSADAGAGTFKSDWVGFYVRIGNNLNPVPTWERYEIISVSSDGSQAEIDTRDDALGVAEGTVGVFGTRGDYTQITFFPDLLADTNDVADLTGGSERTPARIASTCTIKISPSIKTTRVPPGGGGTIASTLAAFANPLNGDYDPDNKYQHASYHCIFKEQTGFNNKITVQARSKWIPNENHLMQIAGGFMQTQMFLPDIGQDVRVFTGSIITGAPLNFIRMELPGESFGAGDFLRQVKVVGSGSGNDGNYYIIRAGTDGGLPADDQIETFGLLGVTIPDANNGALDITVYSSGGGHRITLPGPVPLKIIEQSGHEVFGFQVAQQVDETLDPYLSPEELLTILNDSIFDATAEIIETDVFAGTLNVLATTFNVQDPTADFVTLGVGLGYLLEIQDGDNAGTYFIENAFTGGGLTLARPPDKVIAGFIGNEEDIPYRIFIQQVQITSNNAEAGSRIEVTEQPTLFALPSVSIGTQPAIEAVNGTGDQLCLDGLSAGDSDDGLGTVESIGSDGCTVNIVGGVPSDTTGRRFSFNSVTGRSLEELLLNLDTIKSSRVLLAANNFDENLDRLDAAISSLVTPGQALESSQNQAANLLAKLLSVLTDNYRRISEYRTVIPDASLHIEPVITQYTTPRVRALDALLDSLEEHGFDRAVALLVSGQLQEFFNTTAATATFAGNLLAAATTVAQDIPGDGPLTVSVEDTMNSATGVDLDVNAEVDFTDNDDDLDELL